MSIKAYKFKMKIAKLRYSKKSVKYDKSCKLYKDECGNECKQFQLNSIIICEYISTWSNYEFSKKSCHIFASRLSHRHGSCDYVTIRMC